MAMGRYGSQILCHSITDLQFDGIGVHSNIAICSIATFFLISLNEKPKKTKEITKKTIRILRFSLFFDVGFFPVFFVGGCYGSVVWGV